MTPKDRAAMLTLRWNQIHNEIDKKEVRKAAESFAWKGPKPKEPTLTRTPVITEDYQNRLDDIRQRLFGPGYNKYKDKLDEGYVPPKVVPPDGILNSNAYLQDLKHPITWVGRIAVGEVRNFPGWWGAVPPIGYMFSYAGEGAKDKALAIAMKFKEIW
jgi:hypothetical protein